MINIISLGAGVQSSTLALMAKHGEITPMPDCAIFADTQSEPEPVYEWLRYLEGVLPFPIHIVSAGNLEEGSLIVKTGKSGKKYTKHNVPAFTITTEGKKGMVMRQCTEDFKIVPIRREIRNLLGDKWRSAFIQCVQWIGISYDEVDRMKSSRVRYIQNIWPLVEKRMTRDHCLAWMKSHRYPTPPRSACYFCPFHSDAEWRSLSREDKHRAIAYEKKLQEAYAQVPQITGKPYLHDSRRPIGEFFRRPAEPDLFINNFRNECEGHCGV